MLESRELQKINPATWLCDNANTMLTGDHSVKTVCYDCMQEVILCKQYAVIAYSRSSTWAKISIILYQCKHHALASKSTANLRTGLRVGVVRKPRISYKSSLDRQPLDSENSQTCYDSILSSYSPLAASLRLTGVPGVRPHWVSEWRCLHLMSRSFHQRFQNFFVAWVAVGRLDTSHRKTAYQFLGRFRNLWWMMWILYELSEEQVISKDILRTYIAILVKNLQANSINSYNNIMHT